MAAHRVVKGTPAPAKARAGVATPWGDLDGRQVAQMAAPGVAIGVLGGLIAGGMVAAGGFGLDVVLVATLALAVPMAAAGAGYEILVAKGKVPMSALTPVALYWVVGFPVVRSLHAGLLDLYAGEPIAVPFGWLDFLVYQVLLSVGFAIGYWWLHENFAPRWWYHLRDRNPVADHFIRVKLQYAVEQHEAKEQRKQQQRQRRRDGRR